jgi:hypothetical protein
MSSIKKAEYNVEGMSDLGAETNNLALTSKTNEGQELLK